MQITILTVGSQGDVQPYVALGARLRAAGYDVTLVTSARFEALVSAAGLRHTPVRADFLQLVETPEGKAALAGGNPLKLMQRVMPMLRQLLDDCWEAKRVSDALIYHPKALGGYHMGVSPQWFTTVAPGRLRQGCGPASRPSSARFSAINRSGGEESLRSA